MVIIFYDRLTTPSRYSIWTLLVIRMIDTMWLMEKSHRCGSTGLEPGTYTYIGDVTDIYGSTATLSIQITFYNGLEVTDAI